MKYKMIYYFCVQDEVEKGEKVYCLDREDKLVLEINDMSYEDALGLICDAKDNDTYEFWKETQKDAEEF